MNPEIFKENDIRGIYKKDFNEKDFYKITYGFIKSGVIKKENPKIILGYDLRNGYKTLSNAVKQALFDLKANVIEIGEATTPMYYFAVNSLKTDGGIMITASHNPKEYNGLKIVKKGAVLISKNNGLNKIKKIALNNKININSFKINKNLIKNSKINIIKDYINFLTKNVKINLKEKIVFDTGNGMVGMFLPKLLKKLKINYIPLYFDVDFKFPNHESNPSKQETLKDLKKTVVKEKAKLGVAFDGDGDRIAFIDEKGNFVNSGIILILLAKKILKYKPKSPILYGATMSKIISDEIKKMGGCPIKSKIGHSFLKQKAVKINSPFGGEPSGHYYFKETNYCESSFFVLIKILEILQNEKKDFSEIIKPYKKYYLSPEINFNIRNKEEIIEKLKQKYIKRGGKLEKIDGVSIYFKNW